MARFKIDPLNSQFPHYEDADEHGILAYGGLIHPTLLLDAYTNGIFPWYSGDIPVWWNPNPRFVLFPDELKVAKSMRSYFNNEKYNVTYNQDFDFVIKACKRTKRKGQAGTWLNDDMVAAYTLLHKDGYAHSIEVWDNDLIVGGLYGLILGNLFFGESMFSHKSNASKFGFISLVWKLKSMDIVLIDCQQETSHLASLGAKNIPRKVFMEYVAENKLSSCFRRFL